MKKYITYIILISIVLFMVNLMSIIAWYDDGTPAHPGGYRTTGLVNSWDAVFFGSVPTPPIGPYEDYKVWELHGSPTPHATANPTFDLGNVNTNIHGNNYARIEWRDSSQYLALTQPAFENVGCNGSTGPVDTSTYDPAQSGDWQCWDYIRFYYYLNNNMNSCKDSAVRQKASLYDGSVTFTSDGLPMPCQNDRAFVYHHTMSINYIANQYYQSKGDYFSVSNVAEILINAPDTDFSVWDFISSSDPHLVIYYDWVTLGADDMPNAPATLSNVAVHTQGSLPDGLEVQWNASAQTGTDPISGYHIYRASGTSGAPMPDNPYISVDVVANTYTGYVDKSLPEDELYYCYKILPVSGGPGILPNSVPSGCDFRCNTINATYHEALLYEATPMCTYMPVIPSMTPTATPTINMTETTMTITPTSTMSEDARIYPNPYNPNQGSGKFYTDMVYPGSKISIYAMDGSLVEKGETTLAQQRFVWDGRNRNGSKVVSGLYYLVVEPPEDAPSTEPKVYRIIVCYTCDTVYTP